METQSWMDVLRPLRIAAFILFLTPVVSCAGGGSDTDGNTLQNDLGSNTSYVALAWEAGHPERVPWSTYLYSQIAASFSTLNAATDITNFCPSYRSLSQTQQIEVWAELMVEDSYQESGWDPTDRYEETTLGIDPVTGQPVWSEGLMQMSYQDTLWMPSCRFNWAVDKNLSPTDPNKTILQPDINLQCGVFVLANQIKEHGAVSISTDAYWSTLEPGTAAVAAIKSAVQHDLSFCN